MTSLLGGINKAILDTFTGFFALIPQCMYFFYTCMASFLDLLQCLVRKLAGLDSYTVSGVKEPVTGDLLERYIKAILGINSEYSAVSTVFWSMIIFGLIVLVLSVIISLIKAHYSYNEEKSNPKVPLMKALKSIVTMLIVPVTTVFGIGIANVLLSTLDTITANNTVATPAATFKNADININETFVSGTDEWGKTTYASYDIFGMGVKTGYQTFSGLLFRVAVRDANRVRRGSYTASSAGETWSNAGVFASSITGDSGAQVEDVASQIDYAFANNLQLKGGETLSVLLKESNNLIPSYRYFTSAIWYLSTINFTHFSKFHVGLVWYYYDLWAFNFILGFVGMILALGFMSSIVFGLIGRFIEATALFLVLPGVLAISPLDDENAFLSWRGEFVGDILMSYGAVVGLNLIFVLLPYLQQLKFFRGDFLNSIMDMVIVIVALIGVKQIVDILSTFIGGKDPIDSGESTKKAVGEPAAKVAEKTGAAAMIALKIAKFIPAVSLAAQKIEKVAKKIQQKIREAKMKKLQKDIEKAAAKAQKKQNKALKAFRQARLDALKEKQEALANPGEEGYVKTEKEEEIEKQREEARAQQEELKKEKEEKEKEAEKNKAEAEAEENSDEAIDPTNEVDQRLIAEEIQSKKEINKALPEAERALMEYARQSYEDLVACETEANGGRELTDERKQEIARGAATSILTQVPKTVHSERAQKYRELAQVNTEEAGEIQSQIDDIDKRFEKGGDLSDEVIEKSRQERRDKYFESRHGDSIQGILKFSGETLKTIGGVFSLDVAKDKIEKETKTLDYGRTMLKDFALMLQMENVDSKPFQTKKERDKAKRRKLQAAAVYSEGEKEAQSMVEETSNLVRAFALYKKRIDLEDSLGMNKGKTDKPET